MEPTTVRYAGFWRRFAALIIDGLILGVVQMILLTPLLAFLGLGAATADTLEDTGGFIAAVMGATFLTIFAVWIAGWLYFALMESSSKQATLGKMALSIKVTDLSGNRISFGRATGRYFGKIVSGIILYIGFIMAAFTEKKQALHDMMASSLVVMR